MNTVVTVPYHGQGCSRPLQTPLAAFANQPRANTGIISVIQSVGTDQDHPADQNFLDQFPTQRNTGQAHELGKSRGVLRSLGGMFSCSVTWNNAMISSIHQSQFTLLVSRFHCPSGPM